MPDQKLTQLPVLAALSADDIFYVVDDPAGAALSRKMATSVLDARFATAAQGALAATALQPADIGVTVQAWDADLDTIAGLAKADGNFIVGDGAAWVVESGAVARTSLGLGTIATINDAPNDGLFYGRQSAAWVAASTLPVADTQTIVKGSVTATKLLRFEIDGFTAATTRVITPPDADITLAGQNYANVFTSAQTVQLSNTAALRVWSGGTETLIVNTTNQRVGIGITPTVALDIAAGGIIRAQSATADTTNKFGRFVVGHYTNAEEAVLGFNVTSTSTTSVASFGGNSSVANTVTQLSFFAAADNITLTGTEIVRSTIAGMRVEPSGVAGNAATPLHVLTNDATDNAIVNIVTIGHNTTGTPANGLGTGIIIQAESSTSVNVNQGRLTMEWVDVTSATRAARGKLSAYYTATERECIRWEANSTVAMVGFLGAAAVARPASYTLASTATRTMPTPEAAFTGQDNAQVGAVYAKSADLITLQTRLNNVEGVLRQVIIDLASTSGCGLLAAA